MSLHEFRRYYDLAEANGLLPELELLFAELARIQRKANALGRAAQAAGIKIDTDEAIEERFDRISAAMPSLGARLKELSEEYLDLLDEIADTGVVVCDPDMGLVGFYSLFCGQEILLSWQYGESEVVHWHGVNEHPESRRSLALLFEGKRGAVSVH